MNIVCIIQARMGSTRLPGKVLLPLLDRTVLDWVLSRVNKSRFITQTVVATTTHQQDDHLVAHGEAAGWTITRGSEDDVLDRYYQAAQQYEADIVVRITSDCPMIDYLVLDRVIATHLSTAPLPDYTSNIQTRTYPRGLDAEVFSMMALKTAWQADSSPWREHVTPYIYRTPDRFHLASVSNPTDYSAHRWTLDTKEDYELIRRIYNTFGHGHFTWQDALALIEEHPDWTAINKDIQQKSH